MNFEQKFWKFVKKIDDCWIWQGARTAACYGSVRRNGKVEYAHRVSYELHHGPIPPGMDICHKCDHTLCVCPEHLFLGTRKDNLQDSVQKRRFPRGETHHNAKLSEDEIAEIRASQDMTQKELAIKYNVSQPYIHRILSGERRRYA